MCRTQAFVFVPTYKIIIITVLGWGHWYSGFLCRTLRLELQYIINIVIRLIRKAEIHLSIVTLPSEKRKNSLKLKICELTRYRTHSCRDHRSLQLNWSSIRVPYSSPSYPFLLRHFHPAIHWPRILEKFPRTGDYLDIGIETSRVVRLPTVCFRLRVLVRSCVRRTEAIIVLILVTLRYGAKQPRILTLTAKLHASIIILHLIIILLSSIVDRLGARSSIITISLRGILSATHFIL